MPWARIDDMLPVHPKVRALSDGAFRLYICAICWSNLQMTDGRIDEDHLRYVSDLRGPKRYAEELVRVGLWESADAGWQIHDYLEYQPSADKVRRERAAKKQRQERWRTGRDASHDPSPDVPRDASPDTSHDASSRARAHPIPSHESSVVSKPTDRSGRAVDLNLANAVQQAVAERTGADIPEDHALAIAAQIVGAENVRHPVPYVTAAINRDPNPRRFLPTRVPPPLMAHAPPRPDQGEISERGAAMARALLAGSDRCAKDQP